MEEANMEMEMATEMEMEMEMEMKRQVEREMVALGGDGETRTEGVLAREGGGKEGGGVDSKDRRMAGVGGSERKDGGSFSS